MSNKYRQLTNQHNSIYGRATSLDDTRKVLLGCLPISDHEGDLRKYRASYIVRKRATSDVIGNSTDSPGNSGHIGDVIGHVGFRECQVYGIPFPDHLTLPDSVATRDSVLKMEVGYMFLPTSWGKGFCTEALTALLKTSQNAPGFWSPYKEVYVQAIIGIKNAASRKVAEKAGLDYLGVHKWDGEEVFLGGEWQKTEIAVCGNVLNLRDPKEK